MSKRLLTLTAVLLCAGTAATAQPASAPAKPATMAQPAQADIKPLAVGDKAPEIKVAKFVKGDPITGFEKGKTYVVEFWATWCGPCKQSIPHLTELQKEYKGKVTFLGVSVWEHDQSKVEPFVKDEMGDKMAYTVAMDDVPAGKDANDGTMARTWMRAAGQQGIPTAFVVNGEGRIAWIGHPMQMEEPLKAVVAGTWDINKAAKDAAAGKRTADEQTQKMAGVGKAIQDFRAALAAKEYDKASKAGAALLNDPNADDQSLNFVAWSIVDPQGSVEKKDLDLAMKAAVKADQLSEHKDPAILDTLARVYATKGDYKKAVELETKAVGLAGDDMKADLQDSLKEFQGKLGKGPG